jgi:hypothetical protein
VHEEILAVHSDTVPVGCGTAFVGRIHKQCWSLRQYLIDDRGFPLAGGFIPLVTVPINGILTVGLKPGLVIVVPVVKKEFKGANPSVMISNFHVKIDGCVGQSFIRSYATLTRVTDQSDVVLSYVGVTKAV